ncbi:MAG: hypothetical protein BGO09_05530 [Bacteroidetes bacterium 47-18]|nr:MAG: hypothetical protein BGO09_05530 [Bacteroidetes bacterium 47-18]
MGITKEIIKMQNMNQLFKILLSFLTILFSSSCNANTVVNNRIVTDTIVKINNETDEMLNRTIAEVSGYWYPISYTGSKSQALSQIDIDRFMKMYVFISADTIINFTDTIFDLKYSIDRINTGDYLRMNVDEFYNYKMLDSLISDIFINCKKRDPQKGNIFFTTWSFAYDGTYLLIFQDGVTFLCEKQKSPITFNGLGSMAKEYLLKGYERELNLSYEFFSDPDELVIYDQSKKVIYNSGMQPTRQPVSIRIPLVGVKKLVFKINTKSSKSQWKYEFSFK